jgi:DNA-binding transcriptional MerR regulator
MKYQTRHIMQMFDISKETVRQWSQAFPEFLSPTATPEKGRHRYFTEDDVKVFAWIHLRKGEGALYDEIRVELRNGMRGDMPEERVVVLASVERQIQIALLQETVERLEIEKDELLEQMRPLQDENIKLRTELHTTRDMLQDRITALMEELNTTREKANQELRELYKEIAKLEVRLDEDE